jgi:hypothetical protein
VRVVAVVRGGSEEEEAVAAAGEHLGEPSTAGVLPVTGAVHADAVVRLIDDDEVPGRTLQLLEDLLLLREVDGCKAERDVVEGVGPQRQPTP